jgi:hypothetical protein
LDLKIIVPSHIYWRIGWGILWLSCDSIRLGSGTNFFRKVFNVEKRCIFMKKNYVFSFGFLLVVALSFSMVQAASPIGYWNFDGNYSDFAGLNNLDNYSCGFDNGILNNGLFVNDSHLLNPGMSNFELAPGNISVGAWVKIDELTGGWQTILEYDRHNSGGAGTSWFGIWVSPSDKFHFRVGHINNWENSNNYSSDVDLVEDKWYYLTATFDNVTKVGSIYVDGKLDSNFNLSGVAPSDWTRWTDASSSVFTVGKSRSLNHIQANIYQEAYAEPFFGMIDEIKIYSDVLNDTEILDEYNEIIPHNITIDLISPVDSFSVQSDSYDMFFEFNASGDHVLDICRAYLNGAEVDNGTDFSDVVNFTIAGLVPGNYVWSVECVDNYTNVNMSGNRSFTITAVPAPKPTPSSSSSPSTGGGATCGIWSECIDGIESRICGSSTVVRDCTVIELDDVSSNETNFSSAGSEEDDDSGNGFFSLITGAVTGVGTVGSWLIVALFVILAIVAFVAVKKRKSKK